MNEAEHVEKCKTIVAEWFKVHQAALLEANPDRTVINWRRSDHSNYWMQFILIPGLVIVIGDCGEAIYRVGANTKPEDFLRFDWHYFAGKCVASETGAQYVQKVPGIRHPVINVRAIGHHAGLQMALRQLKADGSL